MRPSLPTRSRRLPVALALTLAFMATPIVANDTTAPSPSGARLKADVSYLADDAREGRAPGTPGIEAAADYIAGAFKDAGLKPADGADGYFQPFEVPGQPKLADDSKLNVHAPDDKSLKAIVEDDFTPLAIGNGTAEGLPLVFAGFGITAHDKGLKLDYDDYDGIDVEGKAVLVLRREPQPDQDDSPFDGKRTTSYATFAHKGANAVKHGARAVLLVNDAADAKDKDELLRFDRVGGDRVAIPYLMITRAFADKILEAAGQPKLAELESQINDDLKPRSRPLEGITVDVKGAIERPTIKTKNVVGVLEGSGPLADQTIIVGAHYDHLGHGGPGSLARGSQAIHNGADDNASGTAMVMEMARRLARRVDPLPRRIVFMAFSGEEMGLLGSAYYARKPLYPLDQTVAMVNYDMVGRLNDQGDLTVFGAGTSPGLDALVQALANSQGFKTKLVVGTRGEFFQSDHASFYRKDIPVLFFFTGNHADYHRPSDDTGAINFAGMTRVADLGELVLLDLARRPDRPKFIKLPENRRLGNIALGGGSGAYLGTRPSYGDSDIEGVRLDGVNDDSPAAKGGIKAGDIVVKVGALKVTDIETYMTALSSYKPGDSVEVVVKRGAEEVTLKVTLGTRPTGRPRD